jgi:hypothetical protein
MLNQVPRGAVSNPARAKQQRDFTGLRYGNITPTDIDGSFDYHGKCFVLYEAKHVTAPPMPYGQKLHLERECDDHKSPTIVIVFEHSTPADKAIDFAVGKVVEIRLWRKWVTPKQEVTVKKVTDWFVGKYGDDLT